MSAIGSSIPSVADRQDKTHSGYYEDPDLVSTVVGGSAHRHHKFGQGEDASDPVSHRKVVIGGWDYGFHQVEEPERLILNYGDKDPVANVGWMSGFLGTEHPGSYLDRQK